METAKVGIVSRALVRLKTTSQKLEQEIKANGGRLPNGTEVSKVSKVTEMPRVEQPYYGE